MATTTESSPAQVEAAPAATFTETTISPSVEPAVAAATQEEVSAAAPVQGDEAPASTATVEDKPPIKRSPFSDLKNKIFAPKSPTTAAEPVAADVKDGESAPVVEETPKENVPSVEDSSAPAAVEGESREIPGVAAAATEEVKKEEDKPVKEKKVKGPTVLEKMKGLFHSGEKKEKKEKAVKTEDKPVVEDSASPIAESSENAPVVSETAQADAPAPVPQVIEPIPAPINEPVAEAPAPVAAAELKETETLSTPAAEPVEASTSSEAAAPASPTAEEGVKFDPATKAEDKPKEKKDLAKLGRRLSAKFGGFLGSPKKSEEKVTKKETPAAVDSEATPVEASTSAEEAPKVETAIDESKLGAEPAVAAKEEEVVPVAEPQVKEEEPVGVEQPKEEAPAAIEPTAPEVPAAVEAVKSEETPAAASTSTSTPIAASA